jgi:Mg-chelatase subunit ChlD
MVAVAAVTAVLSVGDGRALAEGFEDAAPAVGRPLDVLLAVDTSRSMQVNDPQRLLPEAVRGFADQLGGDATLGVMVFGEGAEVVLELGEAHRPGGAAQLEAALKRVVYRSPRTDIPGAVERGLYELREHGRPGAERVLVVLTDGYVDLGSAGRNAEQTRWLMEHLTAEAKRYGIRVFGAAFTEGADWKLLQAIAERTEGSYFRVLAIKDMPRVFNGVRAELGRSAQQAAAQQRGPEQVPVVIELVETGRRAWAAVVADWRLVAGLMSGLAMVAAAGLVVGMQRRRRPGVSQPRMPGAKLRDLSAGGKVYRIRKTVVRIGRAKDNDIVLPCETVSAHHAVLEWRDGAFFVQDLGSTNGTRKNGVCFSERERPRAVRVKHRDRLAFDAYTLEFLETAAEGLPETQVGELAPATGDSSTPANGDGSTQFRDKAA